MIISDSNSLKAVCQKISEADYIALDTEFSRVNTFFPILSLIQISDGTNTFAIDMLRDLDLSPIECVLFNPKILKIIHSCKQDLEVLYNKFGRMPINIFDTQIACQFLGFDKPPSYNSMIQHFLKIELDKKLQFSDWLERPLSNDKLLYALDDVIHLYNTKPYICAELEKSGRLAWVEEENRALELDINFNSTPEELLNKFISFLNTPEQFAQILFLIKLREQKARSRDVIRRKIYSDQDLVYFIQHKRIGNSIKKNLSNSELSEFYNYTPSEEDSLIIKRLIKRKTYKGLEKNSKFYELKELLESICEREKVASKMVATTDEILKYVHGLKKNIRFTKGWRYSLFGKIAEQQIS